MVEKVTLSLYQGNVSEEIIFAAVRLINREKITSAGGVPSMAMDLLESGVDISSIETIAYGGAPAAETMAKDIIKRFPKATPYV